MENRKRQVNIFALALFCVAVSCAMGPNTLSNYFKDAFDVTSAQRGFIEVPREAPGILCTVIVTLFGFIGNFKLAIASQIIVVTGFSILGFFSPSYGLMLCAIFISSIGEHLFMPLNDAMSMHMAKLGDEGKYLGRFRGIYISGSLVGASIIFIGFKVNLFSYKTSIIIPFVLTVLFAVFAIILFLNINVEDEKANNRKFLLRKEYLGYYFITLAYGCQKRIRIVFAPWVIITLLKQGADTIALLAIVCHFIGAWISPIIGKALDKYGYKRMLLVETIYIVFSFCGMGFMATRINDISIIGIFVIYAFYVLCYSFDRFGIVHAFYVKKIAVEQSEVTQTLSTGLSIDHIMAIIISPIMGIIWDAWGVQYVFYLAAISTIAQLAVVVKKRAD